MMDHLLFAEPGVSVEDRSVSPSVLQNYFLLCLPETNSFFKWKVTLLSFKKIFFEIQTLSEKKNNLLILYLSVI